MIALWSKIKSLLTRALVFIFLLMSAESVSAAATDTPIKIDLPKDTLSKVTNKPTLAFDNIFTLILGILGTLGVLALMVGGFRYITAFGNKKRLEAAKSNITYAIMGIVVILLAYIITATISNILEQG